MINIHEKYSRHLTIKGWSDETQKKLTSAHIFVAGAGGLGSPLLFYLAGAGIGNLTICDFDTVSASNLNRQILYTENDIGKSKVFTAARRLKELNSCINITCINTPLSENILDNIEPVDLIIDCLDNFKGRFILNNLSLEKNKPLVHAGISEFFGQITFLKPGETPCLACFVEPDSENSSPGIIGATAGILGSMQAMEAIKYITGIGENLKNRILFVDCKTMEFTIINISKNTACSCCREREI